MNLSRHETGCLLTITMVITRLGGLRDSHERVSSLNKSFALTGIPLTGKHPFLDEMSGAPFSREHPFLYEMSGAPCKFSFSAGFSSY